MENKKSAVALGLFDGVHLGHRAVLELAQRERENGISPVIFTFSPQAVLRKNSGAGGFIYGHVQKLGLLDGFGGVFSADFKIVKPFTGEEFVRHYLKNTLNAVVVCCGADFRFGRGASCGVDDLCKFGEKYGFEVRIAEDVCVDGTIVSSGEIRHRLIEGDISGANKLLGRPYFIRGEVVHGAKLGRTIGFPTINQVFESGQLVPKYGVYAGRVRVDGRSYRAVTNIGMKPTVEYDGLPLAETHIVDFSGDLYGKKIDTEILGFIRPEQKFNSVEELKNQIGTDTEKVCSMSGEYFN